MKPTILLVAFAAVGATGYVLLDDVRLDEAARAAPQTPPRPVRVAHPAAPAWTPPRRPAPSPDVAAEPPRAIHDEAPSAGEMHDQLQTAFAGAALGDVHGTSRSLEAAVRAALPPSSTVRSVECRGSLCRVETTHPDAGEFRAFVQATFQASSNIPSGPAFVSLVGEPVAGQPVTAVAFLTERGAELPLRATKVSLAP